MKFRVHSPEHSRAVQERLFELGYKWKISKTTVCNTKEKFLYCDIYGKLSWGNVENLFIGDEHVETTLDDLYKMTAEDITIGSNVVEFTKTGIKVGCTEVDKETVLKIAERFK